MVTMDHPETERRNRCLVESQKQGSKNQGDKLIKLVLEHKSEIYSHISVYIIIWRQKAAAPIYCFSFEIILCIFVVFQLLGHNPTLTASKH